MVSKIARVDITCDEISDYNTDKILYLFGPVNKHVKDTKYRIDTFFFFYYVIFHFVTLGGERREMRSPLHKWGL